MTETKQQESPKTHRAVRWHPPSYDVRVEDVPFPKVEHPDDAIVKIALAGLCGSDLHIYRGHDVITKVHTSGHEFVGEVVALGSNFLAVGGEQAASNGRPVLYSTLKVGDRVVSPFTVSCGECRPCRQGFSSRCARSLLFGSPALEGGQAQYVRVPYAGGTLFRLDDIKPDLATESRLTTLADSSLLLLADILPTGYFAALQLLQHPKLLPLLGGNPYPHTTLALSNPVGEAATSKDLLSIALIGLGPVGICAVVSLLDLLWKNGISYYRIIAIDPHEQRRNLIKAIYNKILDANPTLNQKSTFEAVDIETAKQRGFSADNAGFDGVIEAVGNTSAISLAFDLVRPFGVITSVGVHQDQPLPMPGRALYGKNVSLDFGRCPVRSVFPLVLDLLVRRQDVFGEVGTETSLVDRIVGFDEAKVYYDLFDKGKCGKVLFDPWK
ncbi:chaperonin 10-like protein [Thelephora terrestris]|uniref:Chaperonin 10-like protein n=1 Tax=Thelephora terrestris TaxID=56493 RepID=A0A9P6HJM1_9AGAM|nr:chaperonin 10-like protein [Thelephora terrestris]